MSDFVPRVVDRLLAAEVVPVSRRARLMRRAGFRIGARPEIYAGARLRSTRITFGDDVFVNTGLFYDGNAAVTVGDRVAFGPGVALITVTHEIGPHHRRCTSQPLERPITIGDGCWLGAGVTILPGVTVAAGCVIGAGATVTASTAPDGLYLGVPARRARDLQLCGR